VDVQAQLGEIRSAVESARSMPMSSSAVVNRAELLAMLDGLRDGLAQAFTDAERVRSSRDDVVDEGRQAARRLLDDAHTERERLLSDTDVFRLAQRQADDLLADARTEAAELRKETDEYVDAKLANFEIALERILEAVRRGRERLAGRTVMDSLTQEEADKITLPEHFEND
jgi:vacuolar-type H+-ATPase subunit H